MYYNLIKWFSFTLQNNVILGFQRNSLVLKSTAFLFSFGKVCHVWSILCDIETIWMTVGKFPHREPRTKCHAFM